MQNFQMVNGFDYGVKYEIHRAVAVPMCELIIKSINIHTQIALINSHWSRMTFTATGLNILKPAYRISSNADGKCSFLIRIR